MDKIRILNFVIMYLFLFKPVITDGSTFYKIKNFKLINTHNILIPKDKHSAVIDTDIKKYCNGSIFNCAVKYLQYLHYLPLSNTVIHKNNYKKTYYNFAFKVPEKLQAIADSYKWNKANPFILGAETSFLKRNGNLHSGEFSIPKINTKLVTLLIKASNKKEFSADPWQWVYIHKTKLPEYAEVWEPNESIYNNTKHHGIIFKTAANTGVVGTTPKVTNFVFFRYPHVIMKGFFPIQISKKTYHEDVRKKNVGIINGHYVIYKYYNDPDIKWVNYFDGGRAIHYYKRSSYGFPQSAGCVELSYQNAYKIYHIIHYGTIVSVQ